MAGWGPEFNFTLCPVASASEADTEFLLKVFHQAAEIWESNVGRRIFWVARNKSEASEASGSREKHYLIEVNFGEWNTKNGYTAPSVRPNSWPYRRCGAKIYLRKRPAEEVAPRTVEEALISTACHELGHALGLSHHRTEGELMYFMGLPSLGTASGSWSFGPSCTAAAKWLYNPKLPKTVMSDGYPTLCLRCYAPGWWSISDHGSHKTVDPAEFRSKGKPRKQIHTRRRIEKLADGTERLITESVVDDENDLLGLADDGDTDTGDATSQGEIMSASQESKGETPAADVPQPILPQSVVSALGQEFKLNEV